MNINQLWHRKCSIDTICITAMSIAIFNCHPSLAEKDKSQWGYGGAFNPTHWNELSTEFESCESGRDQSPVDVSIVDEGEPIEIEFNYQPSAVEVIDNGQTIQVENDNSDNTVSIEGEVYQLLQFHFHTPSEHTIDNESSAMELHLVHQNEAGELAVVGVMIEAGEENATIASIWDAIPDKNKAEGDSSITIDAASLLPEDRTLVTYAGSLTTPPCSEQVSWNLLLEPIEISLEQIETFESFYPYNARPVQPLNGRSINLHPQN